MQGDAALRLLQLAALNLDCSAGCYHGGVQGPQHCNVVVIRLRAAEFSQRVCSGGVSAFEAVFEQLKAADTLTISTYIYLIQVSCYTSQIMLSVERCESPG